VSGPLSFRTRLSQSPRLCGAPPRFASCARAPTPLSPACRAPRAPALPLPHSKPSSLCFPFLYQERPLPLKPLRPLHHLPSILHRSHLRFHLRPIKRSVRALARAAASISIPCLPVLYITRRRRLPSIRRRFTVLQLSPEQTEATTMCFTRPSRAPAAIPRRCSPSSLAHSTATGAPPCGACAGRCHRVICSKSVRLRLLL
jgi:hypothetical protein